MSCGTARALQPSQAKGVHTCVGACGQVGEGRRTVCLDAHAAYGASLKQRSVACALLAVYFRLGTVFDARRYDVHATMFLFRQSADTACACPCLLAWVMYHHRPLVSFDIWYSLQIRCALCPQTYQFVSLFPCRYEVHLPELYNADGCLMVTDPCGVHECGHTCRTQRCNQNKQLTRGVVRPLEVFYTGVRRM
jgi:hypothetical protein